MKKHFMICIILLLIQSTSFCDYELEVPKQKVIINGETLINEKCTYPFYMNGDTLYVPLTWKNQRTFGLSVSDNEKKITIKSGLNSLVFVNETSEDTLVEPTTGMEVNKKIIINGKAFDNNRTSFPFVYKNNVIYMPLSDSVAREYLDIDVHIYDDTIYINSDQEPVQKNLTVSELVNLSFTEDEQSIVDDALSLKAEIESKFKSTDSYFDFYGSRLYKTDTDGLKYSGILVNNNYKYVGQFYNKRYEGLGVIEDTSGLSYVGQFKEGKAHGIGRYYKGASPITPISRFNNGSIEGSNYDFLDFPPKYAKYQNVLIILTEFNDTKLSTNELQWHNYMFGNKYSVGSFYKDISEDKINMMPISEEVGIKNDGVIKVSLDIPHPNSGKEHDKVIESHIKSLSKIDDYIDFSKFDTNKNGALDENELIILNVLAGYEYSSTDKAPSINAFKSNMGSKSKVLDGVSVPTFIAIGELDYDSRVSIYPYQNTPSVGAHEIGHVFGLPDLYDTDYSSSGIGYYGLMSSGTHLKLNNSARGLTPVDFCAWSRIYLKLTDPTLIEKSGEYNVYSKKTKKYNILKVPINDHEYFLIENKTFSLYDAPLSSINKNSGILIWHIDENVINSNYITNSVNDNELLKGVDLEEANESIVGKSVIDSIAHATDSDPYYRTKKVSTFNDITTPSSKDNEGNSTGISIKVIEDGDVAKVLIELKK